MVPKTGSSPIEPLTYLFFTNVASTLAAGSVAIVNLAQNFQALPVSLIGVAISLAAFPTLAATAAAGDRAAFVRAVGTNALTIVVLTTGAAIGLALVGELAIGVLFGGGRFDREAVERTALVLGAFAISVPFESVAHLLSRAIYATRHTLLQVVASLIGFGVMLVAIPALVGELDIVAIPVGFAIGSIIKTAFLVAVLVPRARRIAPAAEEPLGA
jgi:putative peptidoglycan lipid II flippase